MRAARARAPGRAKGEGQAPSESRARRQFLPRPAAGWDPAGDVIRPAAGPGHGHRNRDLTRKPADRAAGPGAGCHGSALRRPSRWLLVSAA
jgi:hypothetical protein